MAKEGSFAIKVNSTAKTLDVLIVGTFTPQQVQDFLADYSAKVKSIDPKEYTLVADSTDMDILTQEMVPAMENTIRMYQQSGFNKLIVTIKKNPIMKMQLNRIFKNANFTNAEVREV